MPGYRFSTFLVSPKQRALLQDGREVPLIPRYFDLLVLLLERRHEAVHRREIFDRVWGDVIVSDTSLNQAVRTIRRTLGDDPREPRFIRTISRHGYRFVFPDVIEVDDEAMTVSVSSVAAEPARAADGAASVAASPASVAAPAPDPFEPLLARITQPAVTEADEEDRREAAELLHALGTPEALRRLGTRDGHTRARALLRDTRWDAAGAGDVPVLSAPDPAGVAREVIALRLRRVARLVARRWAGAALGGALAGLAGGGIGGVLLASLPGSATPAGVAPVLAIVGAVSGAAAGAGVGAGLAIAEATTRSARAAAVVAGAAAGGALVGALAQWMLTFTLVALVGLRVEVGGALEGLVIGAAAGLGYALATRRFKGGLAAPQGRRRLTAVLTTAALCGAGALVLTAMDRPLAGGTIHTIARAAQGSQVSLAPLGRLVGEPDFGPLSRALIGFGEAALFGLGLTWGLTRRVKNGDSPYFSARSDEK